MASAMQDVRGMLDEAWSDAVGGFEWLKSVVMGEFSDNQSLSVTIARMLVDFAPGVVIVTSARDAVAVILRLAAHPEKREEMMEWIVLCACLIAIALPLAAAAAGAAAAGVGAVVGGVAGSQLAAALRAVMLLLAREGAALVEVIGFLRKFMTGNITGFLRAVKFAKYQDALLGIVRKITGQLIDMVGAAHAQLTSVVDSTAGQWMKNSAVMREARELLERLSEWEKRFYAVQESALKQIPLALAELDVRLAKVLAQTMSTDAHVVQSGVKAEKVVTSAPARQEVRDTAGKVLRDVDAGATTKPPAGAGSPTTTAPLKLAPGSPAPKPPDRKPPRKDKPDELSPAKDGPNTKKQEVIDPKVAADRERINELVKAGKIDEARAVLKPYIPKAGDDSWKPFIDRLDVSSPEGKAVFWSGDPEAAKRYAQSNGAVTLETTPGGKVIDGWDEVNKFPWSKKAGDPPWSGDLWNGVSKKYADGVSGEVNIVQTPNKLWDQGTVWQNTEKAIIKDKLNVGEVTRVNISTLNNKGEFVRLSDKYVSDLMSLKGIPR